MAGGLGAVAILVALGAGAYAPAVIAAAAVGMVAWVQLRILRHLQEGASSHYRQVESLASIYAALPIRAPLPPMRVHAMSPDFAREIVAIALADHPRTVVELGSGVSTLLTAYALEVNGDDGAHVYSLDHEPQFASITRRNLAAHGLERWATILDAPLVDTPCAGAVRRWYDTSSLLEALGDRRIDLLVIDGPPARDDPMAREPAMPVLADRLAPGAVIVLDDAGRPGERRIVERWSAAAPGYQVRWMKAEKGAAILRPTEAAASPDLAATGLPAP